MNKIRTILGFLLVVGFAGSAFGAFTENMKYFTVTRGGCYVNGYDGSGNPTYGCSGDSLYLRQSSTACNENEAFKLNDSDEYRYCVKSTSELTSEDKVNAAFQQIVSESWPSLGGNLVIDSDIDLGGFDGNTAKGTCNAQYRPLSFPGGSQATFFGGSDKGYKIKNLCYVYDVNSGAMPSPVGLFSSLTNGIARNIAMEGVRIEIKDSRPSLNTAEVGVDYKPVGAVFGSIVEATLENVTLENVQIKAPMAGGVAGYAKGSTIRNVHGEKNLNIANTLEVTNENGNFAGKQWALNNSYSANVSECTVFLGGVVGMAVDDSIYNVGIHARIEDASSANTPSTLGGMAGIFALQNQNLDYGAFNDTLLLDATTGDYTTLSGGKAMGGFFGEVAASVWNRNFTISRSRVDSVKIVENNAKDVYVGGFVGKSNMSVSRLKIQGSYANADIWNPSEVSGKAYIGGVCGECNSLEEISLTSVKGNIVIDAGFSGSSLFVGGLVGSSTGNNMMKISNTYSIGKIDVQEDVRAKSSTKVGYLFGSLSAGSENLTFASNYHFSADDESDIDGFGFISNGSDITSSWKSEQIPNWNFTYNVRNGESQNLSASNNGEKSSSDMKTKLFAGQLNKNQNPVWSFDTGVNGGLPFFGSNPVDPNSIFVVTFYYEVWDADNKTYKQENYDVPVFSGDDAVAPAIPEKLGYTFKSWNKSFAKVSGNLSVNAEYVINQYEILFVNEDGTELQKSSLDYGTTPSYTGEVPVKTATAQYTYSFVGWDKEFSIVTDTATYTALFDSTVNKYEVVFVDEDGAELQKNSLEYGVTPAYTGKTPVKSATAQYTYSFAGWDKGIVPVIDAMTYTAQFDSIVNVYNVSFIDYDGSLIGDVQQVPYGESAKAPAEPTRESVDGIAYTFEKWSEDFSVVTGNMTVVAVYGSSVIPSSSSEPESSSSSEEPQSSSSSIEPESSSSSVEFVEIVEPRIEQSGNAIRLTFGTNNFDVANKTSARVVVLGDEGVYMDTVLTDSITDAATRGEWVLSPAPIGKFTVKLVLASDVAADSCEKGFTVSGEIEVQPRSWQMIALSALDMAALRDKDDAAFYWWDEVNPIGDYWQYRAYEESAEYNETQGFWYGTKDGNPLKLKAETPTQDAEIVWELDNRYSGWNLVANPHGWYVNMQDAEKCDAEFWRWNPVTAEYETVAILAPYEAIWAKVNAPTTCRISSAPDFSIAMEGAEEPETLAKKALAKSSKGMDWSLRAVLADASGKKDSWNVIGSGNGANMEEPPAGMGDHVNLSIVEGKSRFAKFVKAAAESYSWNMEVNASSARDGFLSFEGMETLAAKGMKVFVTVDGKTIEMTNGKSVPVSLKKDSKTVTVQVSKSAPVVSSNALKGLRAVQQGGSLQIGFTADGMNGTQGLVQLVGVDGKIAATSKFTAVGGANLVTVAAPKSGVYFLRVKVGSQMTSAKFLVK